MNIDLILFCTAFIAQFVGHRIGDYLFQTDWQALNKVTYIPARVSHCLWYSLTIAILTSGLLGFNTSLLWIIFIVTFIEHMIIDSRKPVIWWKMFLERKLSKNEEFDIRELPFFVLVEMDQTIHYIRIFIISLLIGLGLIN